MTQSVDPGRDACRPLFCTGCNQWFECPAGESACPICGRPCADIAAAGAGSAETLILNGTPLEQVRQAVRIEHHDDPLVGRRLHVYECLSLIGRGGMGRVYLATHTDLERRCALKILSPKQADADEDYVSRFLEEGRAAASLVHPNIVTVHAVGQTDGLHFLEMEFIPGRSLQQLIRDEGRLTMTRALALVARVADGLAVAHRAGIIHRDIKPDNVMLTHQGTPKISDFGLAKRVLDSRGRPVADGLCGTPNYMAPELFDGEEASPRSDVYALGVCLFQLLTGRLPWQAESLADLRWKGRHEGIPAVRSLRPEVSLEISGCVARMTDPVPGNRPKDATEVALLLHAVLGHERDLESLLLEAFQNHPDVTWQRDGDRYVVRRKLPGHRNQTVFLDPSSHEVGNRLLLFYSVCCQAQPEYYEQALRMNSTMLHGSLAIREIDGVPHFVVVESYPRSTVDPDEIRRSVLEISHHADTVEQELTGQDRH